MKVRLGLSIALALLAVSGVGYVAFQNTLMPIPLIDGRELYVPANPEFDEAGAHLGVLMPVGPGLEAFLANQSDLTLIEKTASGAWAGQLISGFQVSRHGRRWQITLRPAWRMQDGASLDATRVAMALGPEVKGMGGELRVIDPMVLECRFRTRPEDPPGCLARWRVPGSGPFIRQGQTLTRFDGFIFGKAGLAGLSVSTDPALLESHAWATGLATGRWAWTVFPGRVTPEDMAKVRMASYDERPMKDGTVWFLSRRLRRLRPSAEDWTRTRLFGTWKGAMDLPYDPLGL